MEWLANISGIFNKLVASVVIILIGFIIGKVVSKLTRRVLHEAELDKIIRKTGLKVSLEKSISQLVEYLIYGITIIISLNNLGVTSVIFYVLAIIIIFTITISILLAIKDFIPNFIAGLTIKKRNLFKKGDYIKINGIEGEVSSFSNLETRLITKKKDIISIPNSIVANSKITVKN